MHYNFATSTCSMSNHDIIRFYLLMLHFTAYEPITGESEGMTGQRVPCHREEYGRYGGGWGEEEGYFSYSDVRQAWFRWTSAFSLKMNKVYWFSNKLLNAGDILSSALTEPGLFLKDSTLWQIKDTHRRAHTHAHTHSWCEYEMPTQLLPECLSPFERQFYLNHLSLNQLNGAEANMEKKDSSLWRSEESG